MVANNAFMIEEMKQKIISMNMNVENISKATGLSIEEIEKLRN